MPNRFINTKLFGLLVIALSVAAVWGANHYWIKDQPALALVATIAIVIVALVFAGLGIVGEADGILIDDRNRISLSKFQITMWTVLVVASLIVIGSHNLELATKGAPLNFKIPPELLATLGISAASFVSSPVVLSYKAKDDATQDDKDKAQTKVEGATFTGKLVGHSSPAEAVWTDMLVGEEAGNVGYPDLGKIQQLFISLLIVGIYGFAVYHKLIVPEGQDPTITELPPLGENFVWLMAVSHASYIAYKAAPHTKTA